jgi:hypothetical protein
MGRNIVTPVDLLAELADRGTTISASEGGRVRVKTDRGNAILSQACRRWRWVLAWGLHGAESGYKWFACDTCGSLAPMGKKPGGTCFMTFGCKGHSIEIPQPRFAPGAPHRVRAKESALTAPGAVGE